MLTEAQVEEKLKRLGKEFQDYVAVKQWGMAHNAYREALIVAVFMELSEQFKTKLFGPYGISDTEDIGLFCKADVHRVNYESCVKRNMAYQDIACRKEGQPVRYYSEADYCALCEKAKK